MIQTAILGYGNIGSGVAEVLCRNRDRILAKVGEPIEVKYVLDLREFPGDPMEDRLVHDASVILNDPEISIVVETMGGTTPAYEFVRTALMNGKHVATSNKELVAAHGTELLAIAAEKKVNFLFEASVGGGIPIIRPLNACIVSDHIKRITGILNGTTNYMLQRMSVAGLDFAAALKEAQDLGFAERNPEADVEGKDACRKIAILCSMAFGYPVQATELAAEGITKVSDIDMKYAAQMGMQVKLLADAVKTEEGLRASVAPVMIAQSHPLAHINGVMNAVLVEGDISGQLLFSGAGAGKLPTASAVVADVVEAALNPQDTVLKGWRAGQINLLPADAAVRPFFLRVAGCVDADLAKIQEKFVVTEVLTAVEAGEFAVVTEAMTEAEFVSKCEGLEGLRSWLRMETVESAA